MAAAGVDIFTFHVEVTSLGNDLTPFIQQIKSKNMKVGVAVKPGTSIETVFPYLSLLDQVLVMTVEPGFGGQKFMVDMMTKVKYISLYLKCMKLTYLIATYCKLYPMHILCYVLLLLIRYIFQYFLLIILLICTRFELFVINVLI